MSKQRGRHAKRGGRTTPKGARPLPVVRDGWEPLTPAPPREGNTDSELTRLVGRALAASGPLDLLTLVSSILWASHPASAPTELLRLDELVEMWSDVDDRTTSALLATVAEMASDPALRKAAGAEVVHRDHRLPAWVNCLAQATVTRAVEVSHVLGDGEAFLIELRVPGASAITVDVYVDHNLGTVVKDAFVAPEAIDRLLVSMADLLDDPHTTVAEVDLNSVRAKIDGALARPLSAGSPFSHDGDSWPQSRPLVEWVLRLLPSGGTGYVSHRWTVSDQQALSAAFFASPYGRALRDARRQMILQRLLDHIIEGLRGDPMRWSPVTVELVMVGELDHPDLDAELLPDLLRAFVGYCHAERHIPVELTEATIDSVERWVPELRQAITDFHAWDGPSSFEERQLEDLAHEVGSETALHRLDAAPLPDEPFVWDEVPTDIRERVAAVLEIIDATCESLFDVEVRTAARRLVARVVAGDPTAFARRGRDETAAAALLWIVATASDAFAEHGIFVKDFMAHLGLVGRSPAQRADNFLRAARIDTHRYPRLALGDPSLLTAARRRWIISRRDRCAEALRDAAGPHRVDADWSFGDG
ncbi:MAG: DUF6398 domain-containing protein [Acidimicrobiales bacterium]